MGPLNMVLVTDTLYAKYLTIYCACRFRWRGTDMLKTK